MSAIKAGEDQEQGEEDQPDDVVCRIHLLMESVLICRWCGNRVRMCPGRGGLAHSLYACTEIPPEEHRNLTVTESQDGPYVDPKSLSSTQNAS